MLIYTDYKYDQLCSDFSDYSVNTICKKYCASECRNLPPSPPPPSPCLPCTNAYWCPVTIEPELCVEYTTLRKSCPESCPGDIECEETITRRKLQGEECRVDHVSLSTNGPTSFNSYIFGTPDHNLYAEVFAGLSIASEFPCHMSNKKSMHSPTQLNCLDIGSEVTFMNALQSNSPKFGQNCGTNTIGDGIYDVFDMAVLSYIERQISPYDSVKLSDPTVNAIAPQSAERCTTDVPYTCASSVAREAHISFEIECTHEYGSWVRFNIHEPVAALHLELEEYNSHTMINLENEANHVCKPPKQPSYHIDSEFQYFSTWSNGLDLITFPESLDSLNNVSVSVWIETNVHQVCLTEKSRAMLSSDTVKLQRCFEIDHVHNIRPSRKLYNSLSKCTPGILSALAAPFDKFDLSDVAELERVYFDMDISHICGCNDVSFDLNCDGQFTFHDVRAAKNMLTAQEMQIIPDKHSFNLYTHIRSINTLTISMRCAISKTTDFVSIVLHGNIKSYSTAFPRFSKLRAIKTSDEEYHHFAIYRDDGKQVDCGALFDVTFNGKTPTIVNLNEKSSNFLLHNHETYPQTDDMLRSNMFSSDYIFSKIPFISHNKSVYLQNYIHVDPTPTYGCLNPFAANYMQGAIIESPCVIGGCMKNDQRYSYTNNTKCNILGCTDISAVNYNSNAEIDDGSCLHPECTIPSALNYVADARVHGGVCVFSVIGCMDETAINYDSRATIPGNCQIIIPGCTLSASVHFNSAATHLNEECVPIEGCTNEFAENYNSMATVDDGTCRVYGCTISSSQKYDKFATFSDKCACENCQDLGRFETMGCSDPKATNYVDAHRHSHGKCKYGGDISNLRGCMDSQAWNYDSNAVYDSSNCLYKKPGCTVWNETINYDPSATFLDLTQCIFKKYGCMDATKVNYDKQTNTQYECIQQEIIRGCGDSSALNYNNKATHAEQCEYSMYGCMDESSPDFNPRAPKGALCRPPVVGCMYPLAQNYDPNANIDDVELCIY